MGNKSNTILDIALLTATLPQEELDILYEHVIILTKKIQVH